MIAPFSARGDSYFSIDLRTSRRSASAGERRLEVLFEMFNLTNTTNFGGYDGNMRSSFFGQTALRAAAVPGPAGLRLDFSRERGDATTVSTTGPAALVGVDCWCSARGQQAGRAAVMAPKEAIPGPGGRRPSRRMALGFGVREPVNQPARSRDL